MSNLSDIGFPAQTGREYGQLITLVATEGEKITSEKGVYIKYSDPSGAELFCQVNKKNEILGMNPHYSGKSRFSVFITNKVERNESALDGSFYGWAEPTDKNSPESGTPFIFDLPDFYTLPTIKFPYNTEIQLSAFAQSEIIFFNSEQEFINQQTEGIKFPSKSLVAIGLFPSNKEDNSSPEAYALLNGIVLEWEIKKNKATGVEFYWLLTETLGGVIDMVIDKKLIQTALHKGSIISGQFWLSGKLLS